MLSDSDVQELLDRSRIADTIYAFCDYVDKGDVEAVVELFAADGLMDLGGGAIHRGHAELRDMFADRFRLYQQTSFHCSGVRLARYDGDTASTTTYLYGIHVAANLNRQMHLWGRYEDEMVNESGTWRFHRRRLRVAGVSHNAPEVVPPRFNRTDLHTASVSARPAAPARWARQRDSAAVDEQPAGQAHQDVPPARTISHLRGVDDGAGRPARPSRVRK